jgi:hypothetical protein
MSFTLMAGFFPALAMTVTLDMTANNQYTMESSGGGTSAAAGCLES